jgi:hypothetical protein
MPWSSKSGLGATALCLALAFVCPGSASAGPDAGKLRDAADSFEAGARAFKDKRFEEAATHFEAADSAVPSEKSLRLAIRARSEANQGSRAATLAALALELYPDEAEITKLSKETIAKFAPKLEQVKVSCASPCILAASSHVVHGEARTRWTIYVEPGKSVVAASFFGDIAAPEQSVVATAGANTTLKFEPPKDVGKGGSGGAPPPPPPPTSGSTSSTSSGLDASTGSGNEIPPNEETPPPKKPFGIHPAAFGVGLAITAALGATTIWSGIDTQNNPGPDKVKADCVGQGEECPTYQEGLAHELRTNVLIGVTAGVGATTVILAIVTNWKGTPKKQEPTAEEQKASAAAFRVTEPRLWVDVLGASSSSTTAGSRRPEGKETDPTGAVVGLRGRF